MTRRLLVLTAITAAVLALTYGVSEAHHDADSYERVVLVNLSAADGIPAASGAVMDAPPLSVTRDTLPLETAQELRRRRPNVLIVVGGTAVVSNAVIDAARMESGAASVVRCSGSNRHATAADCARFFFPGTPPAPVGGLHK